jgi:hypothetical protein
MAKAHISVVGINILARQAAKKAVTEQLRAAGVRITLVKPAEIAAQAQTYLAQHPELYEQAREHAQRMGMVQA